MKYIVKAIILLLFFVLGFAWISTSHLLNIFWSFNLNPNTSWKDSDLKKRTGPYHLRYKSWWQLIVSDTIFAYKNKNRT